MTEQQQANPMLLGWLDNNQEEQDKIKEILNLLHEKGTLDEIGIGTIRDAFSNKLFPGIVTNQTRAKYLVILPYLFKDADKEAQRRAKSGKPCSPDELIHFIYEEQRKLIKPLEQNSDDNTGTIGSRNQNVVQTPMDIYWSAMKAFQMVDEKCTGLKAICQNLCDNAQNKAQQAKVEDNEQKGQNDNSYSRSQDDQDVNVGRDIMIYPVQCYRDDWKKDLKMELTRDEAEFLYEKITNANDSVLAQLLKYYREQGVSDVDFSNFRFGQIPEAILEGDAKDVFQLASAFRKFIFGAHIAYNYLVSNKQDQNLKEAFDEWKNQDFNNVPLKEIFQKISKPSWHLEKFLTDILKHAQNGEWDKFEECVEKREYALKGSRRKIKPNKKNRSENSEKTLYKSKYNNKKDVAPDLMLDYRAHRAGVILGDILMGLNSKDNKENNA